MIVLCALYILFHLIFVISYELGSTISPIVQILYIRGLKRVKWLIQSHIEELGPKFKVCFVPKLPLIVLSCLSFIRLSIFPLIHSSNIYWKITVR